MVSCSVDVLVAWLSDIIPCGRKLTQPSMENVLETETASDKMRLTFTLQGSVISWRSAIGENPTDVTFRGR